MSAEVYLVEGSRGDYEHTEYIVAAFTDKGKAEQFAAEAKEQSVEVYAEMEALRDAWFEENDGEGGPAYEAWSAREDQGTHTALDRHHEFAAGEETTYTVIPVPLDPTTIEGVGCDE